MLLANFFTLITMAVQPLQAIADEVRPSSQHILNLSSELEEFEDEQVELEDDEEEEDLAVLGNEEFNDFYTLRE